MKASILRLALLTSSTAQGLYQYEATGNCNSIMAQVADDGMTLTQCQAACDSCQGFCVNPSNGEAVEGWCMAINFFDGSGLCRICDTTGSYAPEAGRLIYIKMDLPPTPLQPPLPPYVIPPPLQPSPSASPPKPCKRGKNCGGGAWGAVFGGVAVTCFTVATVAALSQKKKEGQQRPQRQRQPRQRQQQQQQQQQIQVNGT